MIPNVLHMYAYYVLVRTPNLPTEWEVRCWTFCCHCALISHPSIWKALVSLYVVIDIIVLLLQLFYSSMDFVWVFPGKKGKTRIKEGKISLDLLEQDIVSGSSITWDICKSASRPRQIATPASCHSVFYRPDAHPATQPTVSKA